MAQGPSPQRPPRGRVLALPQTIQSGLRSGSVALALAPAETLPTLLSVAGTHSAERIAWSDHELVPVPPRQLCPESRVWALRWPFRLGRGASSLLRGPFRFPDPPHDAPRPQYPSH